MGDEIGNKKLARLIDIYSACDKNHDNNLSRDELASLMGAYNSLNSNDDVKLNRKERNNMEAKLEEWNGGDNIKKRHLNEFFGVIKSLVSKNDKDSETFYYNNDGNIIGGKTTDGREYSYTPTQNGHSRTFNDNNEVLKYDNDDNLIGGISVDGREYRYATTPNGFSRTFDDNGEVLNYDNDNNIIGGKTTDGRVYTQTIPDSSNKFTRTFDDGEIVNFENTKIVSGKNPYGEYNRTYNADGSYKDVFTDTKLVKVSDIKYGYPLNTFRTPPRVYSEYTFDSDGKLISAGKYPVVYNQDKSFTIKCGNYAYNYDSSGLCVSETWGGNKRLFEYNSDGSYVEKYGVDKSVYNENHKHLFTELGSGEKYTYVGDNSIMVKFTRVNGDVEYTAIPDGCPNPSLINYNSCCVKPTQDGGLIATAKNGETFAQTMARIGITEQADIDAFKAANPSACRRGWFKVGQLDVNIPASIAAKIDIGNLSVVVEDEIDNYKNSIS